MFDDVIIGEKDDTEHDSIQFWILLVRAMFTLLSSSSEYPSMYIDQMQSAEGVKPDPTR